MLLQDVLKKPEYFGKFGKIHKVVINTSTAYAGNQNQVKSQLFDTKNDNQHYLMRSNSKRQWAERTFRACMRWQCSNRRSHSFLVPILKLLQRIYFYVTIEKEALLKPTLYLKTRATLRLNKIGDYLGLSPMENFPCLSRKLAISCQIKFDFYVNYKCS